MLRSPFVLDVFIGGCWDWFSRLVIDYREEFAGRYPWRRTCYFEHDQCAPAVTCMLDLARRQPQAHINLIGHSWGAATAHRAATRLAQEGIAIDLLITADPVGRGRRGELAGATTWLNLNAAPARSNGWRGDHYALIGGKWGDWPRGRTPHHYDLPFHHNEFRGLLDCPLPAGYSAHGWLLERAARAAERA